MTQRTDQHGTRRGGLHVAAWLIVGLLTANAGLLLFRPAAVPAQDAAAAVGRDAATGVFVVPGQISRELWGVYLIDSRAGTIVLYQFNPNSAKLKLVAARSYIYDRYLPDYNTEPPPSDIAALIQKLRAVKPDAPGGPGSN